MAKQIQLYRLFFAAPSEISEERSIVADLVTEWNVQHGQPKNVHIEVASWRTHSFPAYGDRPQAIINKQVFDSSDIVVGVFWTHFGTPTGEAESGTEEEIRRGISQGKKVLVYFSDRAISPSQMNVNEYQKIQTFKTEYANRGVYSTYGSIDQFKDDVRKHLALMMNELTGSNQSSSSNAKEGDKEIAISLPSKYWTLVLAAIDPMIGMLRQRAEELHKIKAKPEDLSEAEQTVLVGPLIARGIIVDELAKHGVINAKGKEELGMESILRKVNASEAKTGKKQ